MLARTFTASLLIPAIIFSILWAPLNIFSAIMLILISIAAYEAGTLCGLQTKILVLLYSIFTITSSTIIYLLLTRESSQILIIIGGIFWALNTIFLLTWKNPIESKSGIFPLMLFLNWVSFVIAWISMLELYKFNENGAYLLLSLFILIWLVDSSAFFAGRSFGTNKLAPTISPNKTWEGVLGSLVSALIFSLIFNYMGLLPISIYGVFLIVFCVTMCSIGGDLFESFLKRKRKVKDSGNILPGHGGFLDRIDSILSALPVFASGIIISEWFL